MGRGKENKLNRWEDGKREGRISVIFTTDLLPSLVTDTQTHNCFPSTRRGRYVDPWGGGSVAPDPDTFNMIPSSVYQITRLWLEFLMRHFPDIVSNIVWYLPLI